MCFRLGKRAASSTVDPGQQAQVDQSPVRAFPLDTAAEMIRLIDQARQTRRRWGKFVVYATGLLPSLGSHVHRTRLDRHCAGDHQYPGSRVSGLAPVSKQQPSGSAVHDRLHTPEAGFRRTAGRRVALKGE